MPKPPNRLHIILNAVLDAGGIIESDNVNATLQQLTGLTSKQIGNALYADQHKPEPMFVKKSNGTRTVYLAVRELPKDEAQPTVPAKRKQTRKARPAKAKKPTTVAKPTWTPSQLPADALTLGEHVVISGLHLTDDDTIIHVTVRRGSGDYVHLTAARNQP